MYLKHRFCPILLEMLYYMQEISSAEQTKPTLTVLVLDEFDEPSITHHDSVIKLPPETIPNEK